MIIYFYVGFQKLIWISYFTCFLFLSPRLVLLGVPYDLGIHKYDPFIKLKYLIYVLLIYALRSLFYFHVAKDFFMQLNTYSMILVDLTVLTNLKHILSQSYQS